MRQRVASAPPALAVTGKGVSESARQSRLAKVSQTAAAASADGGSAAEEKCTPTHKRPLLAKKGAPNGPSSGQQGRALVRESKSITKTTAMAGLCRGAEPQHSLHSLQPSPSTALEVSLVQNLKKQIACLEAQLHVMNQQQDTMTRTHRHSNASNHGESARAAATAAAARLISVELTLPHAERIRHKDATASSVTATESDDVAVARMREIPAAYQTERSVLLHNLESLTKDVEGLQSLVLHLGRERDLMAAEVVDFRAALRETKVENESMAAECAATHRLLEKEQALRRAAEESVRQCTTAASSHRSSMTVADAYSQRDYYKLQAERTAEALTLAKARTHALSDALQRERDAAKTLETQLCGALDRISQMKRRDDELARYYQQLSSRFVTISATLRHVLDVVPKAILQQQRVPSPERAPAGQPQAVDMTMDELRDTLDAWHREAAVGVAKAQQKTEAVIGDALALLETATETITTVTSGLDNGMPVNSDEAAATAPTRCAAARAMVGSEESAIDEDALPVAQTFEEVPRSSSWEAVTPVTHLLPAVPTPTAGAGNAAPSTCSDEKGFKGLVVDAALPVQLYEVSDAAAMPLPPSAAAQKTLATLETPTLNPAAVDHAVEVREVAQSPADEKSVTEHVAVDSAAPLTSERTAEMTAEKSAAARTAVGIVVGIAVGAPSFSGDALAVPPAAHVVSDPDPVPVISSTPPPQDSEDTRQGSLTMHHHIIAVLFLLASACACADALSVELAQSTLLGAEAELSQHAVQFSNSSLCFHTVAADDQNANTIASTHCTFDSGSTFEVIKNVDDMCLRGIVVDHQLFCPHEQVQQPEDGDAEYAAFSFKVQNATIYKENSERRFVFKGDKLTGVLNQVYFNGNAIYMEEDDAYIFLSTTINEAEDKKVVVFRSEDGFVYNAISVIPNLQEAQQHYMIYEGGRVLSVVSSFNGSYYTSVSSGYAGRHWSAMRMLNVSTPPASVMFSGVKLQYACSNETSERAKWYVVDDNGRHAIKKEAPELPAVSKATSRSPFLAFSLKASDSDKKRLLVLQTELIDDRQTNIRASLFSVDDSAEEKEKAERIEKWKKEQQKREAARFKAKLERLEREKALRRERRRREAERKAQFITLDEPNVRAAKEFFEKDGEMILVRRVNKDSVAFEKEVFFSDL